jgi:hypothetical protein
VKRGGALLAAALLLAACGQGDGDGDNAAGARLEATAIATGVVADPAAAPLDGIWSRDSDRMCIIGKDGAAKGAGRPRRIGIVLDYGEGQGCSASGLLTRDGATLGVTLGRCRFTARFDGEAIQFPASLPAECQAFCTGRASLSALMVERVSASAAEARTLRGPGGTPLCAD